MNGLLKAAAATALVLACGADLTHAASLSGEVMLVNAKTAKCVTIAGGTVSDNNIEGVQFTCDADTSRRWMLSEFGSGVYQIRNVKTHKCLTIAGGTSSNNNLVAVQFNCDNDPSRRWRIYDVTGTGLYQIRNLKTSKCLTIAGGTLADNNLRLVQYNCDTDLSRRWTIRFVGTGANGRPLDRPRPAGHPIDPGTAQVPVNE